MLNIREWFSWPGKLRDARQTALAAKVAQAAVIQVGLPWRESQPGIWSAFADPQHGYQVRLDIFTQQELVICMTRAEINIHRPWIPQQLAVLLLEENNRYIYGSNRLLDGPGGMSVVHSHVCDSRRSDAAHVAEIGRTVIRQMQQLVLRLYAEELVLSPSAFNRTLELG